MIVAHSLFYLTISHSLFQENWLFEPLSPTDPLPFSSMSQVLLLQGFPTSLLFINSTVTLHKGITSSFYQHSLPLSFASLPGKTTTNLRERHQWIRSSPLQIRALAKGTLN